MILPIEREWNGAACDDRRLHARVELQAREAGLSIAAHGSDPEPARVPDAPPGARVDDLWRYDVVECFWVGRGGRYLEVEIGAGGHFLVLSFDAPRHRVDGHEQLHPPLEHARGASGWRADLLLDWQLVPLELAALNAFVIARGQHLAHAPLPGDTPDFHQPASFPPARLEP